MSTIYPNRFLLAIGLIVSLSAHKVSIGVQRPQAPQTKKQEQHGERRNRVAPPAIVKCRDSLTSYNGRVLYFNRRTGRTVIRIRTDWETTEKVTLHHPNTDDPSKLFLLNGEPFKPSDWRLIERSKNRLRPGMRANIWVCERGNTNPIVDWRPDETDQKRHGRQGAAAIRELRLSAGLLRHERFTKKQGGAIF